MILRWDPAPINSDSQVSNADKATAAMQQFKAESQPSAFSTKVFSIKRGEPLFGFCRTDMYTEVDWNRA